MLNIILLNNNRALCSKISLLPTALKKVDRVYFSVNSTLNYSKKGNIKYFRRGNKAAFNKDDSDLPIFQYANEDAPEQKQRLFMWGNSEFGQLGQQGLLEPKSQKRNPTLQMHKPFRVTFGEYEEVEDVSCGYGFTLLATNSASKKRLFGTGFNQSGQIGYHERSRGKPLEIIIQPSDIKIPFPSGVKVKKVSAGRAHTLVLGSNGDILTLGNNAYGQAGRPIIENEDYIRNRLINQIKLEHKIIDLVAGQDHSILITDKGQVMSAGWGADGQTGLGHYNNQDKFSIVGGDIKGENIVKVACRADNVLALNDKGELFGWGNSEYGQFREITDEQQINEPKLLSLGIGKIKDIASGGTVCLVLNEAGEVFVWGYGILGKGPNLTTASKPELIPGTLFGVSQFSADVNVVSVHAGLNHQAVINSIGDLYIWGQNKRKCLGLGNQGDQMFPIKVSVAGKVDKVSLGVDHTACLARSWS